MANHKRHKPKSRRAGCLWCKPWKHQGATRRTSMFRATTRRESERAQSQLQEQGS